MSTEDKWAAVPPELKSRKQWVGWRYEPNEKGDLTKPLKRALDGRPASHSTPWDWVTFSQAAQNAGKFDGIGFVFKSDDPYVGIDLDDCLDENGNMLAWGQAIYDRVKSYAETSPSGKGIKIFAKGKLPQGSIDAPTKHRKKIEGGEIEIYDQKRYFTVTGIAFGDEQNIVDRGPEILTLYAELFPEPVAAPRSPRQTSASLPGDDELINIARNANDGGKFDRLWGGSTIDYDGDDSRADSALVFKLTWLTGGNAAHIDRLFRQSGLMRDKWDRQDYRDLTINKALQKVTKYYDPSRNGDQFCPDIPESEYVIPTSGKKEVGIPSVIVSTPAPALAPGQFPAELLNPPGITGEICRWIDATASQPQPVLTLANVLPFWGAIVGRKVQAPRRARTNLYCLGVGATGCGKNHSRIAIKELADAAGILHEVMGGEEVSSDSAIYTALSAHPSLLFQFDEIGHMLVQSNGRNAQAHQKNIAPTFTRLYTSANTFVPGKQYAGERPRLDLDQPNACLYGTTVPSKLYSGLQKTDIEDGFMGRIMVFQSHDQRPELVDCPLLPPTESIIKAVQFWFKRDTTPKDAEKLGNLERRKNIPMTIPYTGNAAKTLAQFNKFCDAQFLKTPQPFNAIWSRANEHAIKTALVIATGCDWEHPEIDDTCAAWAIALVSHIVPELIETLENSVASSQFEANTLQVYAVIKRGPISKTDLFHATRNLGSRERQEALYQLDQSDKIKTTKQKKAGSPETTIYSVR